IEDDELAETVDGPDILEVGAEEAMGDGIGPGGAAVAAVQARHARLAGRDEDVAISCLRLARQAGAAEIPPQEPAVGDAQRIDNGVVARDIGDVAVLGHAADHRTVELEIEQEELLELVEREERAALGDDADALLRDERDLQKYVAGERLGPGRLRLRGR